MALPEFDDIPNKLVNTGYKCEVVERIMKGFSDIFKLCQSLVAEFYDTSGTFEEVNEYVKQKLVLAHRSRRKVQSHGLPECVGQVC